MGGLCAESEEPRVSPNAVQHCYGLQKIRP